MSELKYNCEIVRDLLPLYQDEVCSEPSRKMVEEHLGECESCKIIAGKLKNTSFEEQLAQEKESVLDAHAKKERNKTFIVGICTAGILMIPVIVCLICNLAIGHALDWFFIVLASLMVAASLTVVPLMVPERRGIWTLLSFTVSLILLLLVICLYSHGNWFFMAAVPVVLGLSVVFMPYVICNIPLPGILSRSKGLLTMLWDTVWLYLVIIVCGIHTAASSYYWHVGLLTTTFSILLPWSIFGIVRYTKLHALTKAGLIIWDVGFFTVFTNDVVTWIVENRRTLTILNASLFGGSDTVDADSKLLMLIVSAVAGALLMGFGIAKRRRDRRTEKR